MALSGPQFRHTLRALPADVWQPHISGLRQRQLLGTGGVRGSTIWGRCGARDVRSMWVILAVLAQALPGVSPLYGAGWCRVTR